MEAIRTSTRSPSPSRDTDRLISRPEGQVPQMPTHAEMRAMGVTFSQASQTYVPDSHLELPSYEVATANAYNSSVQHPQNGLQTPKVARHQLLQARSNDLEAQMPQSEQEANVLGMHPGFAKPLLASMKGATFAAASTAGSFYMAQGAELALSGTTCNWGPTMALGGLAGLLGAGAMFTGHKFDRDSSRIDRASDLAFDASVGIGYVGVLASYGALAITHSLPIPNDQCAFNIFATVPPLSLMPWLVVGGSVIGGYKAAKGIVSGTRHVINFVNNSRAATGDTTSA